MASLYTFGIRIYGLVVSLASLFSAKARAWTRGRQNLFDPLQSAIATHTRWLWFHAASLGEFEQGRPLIEWIRQRHPDHAILLTFFSPSGYTVRKSYNGADYVTYMPLDTRANAKRFIEIVNPEFAIFIKYEIWYNHLYELEKRAIPAYLISANLRPDQFYFKPLGRFIGLRLRALRQIFTQTEAGEQILRSLGFDNVRYAGDTRVDRVITIARSPKEFAELRQLLSHRNVLVAGSTWPADESHLLPAVADAGVSLIIAPHEIHENRLAEIEHHLPGAVRLSGLKDAERVEHVIVDTIGDLSSLYALGNIAYVGGGFGKGIHNILEPAAYGIPVIIGPRYQKFVEAHQLIDAGAVRSVTSVAEVEEALRFYLNHDRAAEVKLAIAEFLRANSGATQRIYDVLKNDLQLE